MALGRALRHHHDRGRGEGPRRDGQPVRTLLHDQAHRLRHRTGIEPADRGSARRLAAAREPARPARCAGDDPAAARGEHGAGNVLGLRARRTQSRRSAERNARDERMKYLASQALGIARSRDTRQNLRILARYLVIVALMIVVYSVLFHVLMAMEGQSHSWLTGIYWTLTVMSTLGFGDITFQSDLGRFFSVFVLLSGVVVLLILLPFTFIEFFYAPWLEAQRQRRAPRTLPAGTHGHVLITDDEPVALALIERLRSHERAYYLIEPDPTRALELHDLGYQGVVGQHDDLETYRRARADEAAMIVATGDDYMNTNVAFTVRELDPYVPIVAFARSTDSYDVLELAGA